MNYIENNGKKVAAVLCVASCFPVVATVYAMETEPGWHGDKYVKEDATVAKGWEEIEGKSYYFSEDDGTVEKETTQKAVVASVSSSISSDVQETVSTVTQEAVVEEVQKQEEEKQAQVVAEQEAAQAAAAAEAAQTPADTTVADTTDTTTSEAGAQDTAQAPAEDTGSQESTQAPAENTGSQDTNVSENTDANAGSDTSYQEPTTPDTSYQEPTQDTTTTDTTNYYGDLNARIAAAAQGLVGVTDGQWCTQVVQQALANAGVSDAYQLWPDQYAGVYGYYTDTPEAGNLIYYNNGGRGVDHIAVYIGNGLAVHGNYTGYNPVDGQTYNTQTVISYADIGPGAAQYIQVCR